MSAGRRSLYAPTFSDGEMLRARARRLLYGVESPEAMALTADEIVEAWVAEWRARAMADKDIVVMVTGPPGSGKSTLVLRLARAYDPGFGVTNLKDRVAFSADDVFRIYETCGRGDAASIDEAASAKLLATETFDPVQKMLVEAINIIRSRNVLLFILMPDAADLAKAFRGRRADYHIQVADRDETDSENYATVGRRVRRPRYRIDDGSWLGFSDDATYNPLTFRSLDGDPLWAAYLPLKRENQARRIAEMRRRTTGREE